MLMRTTRSTSGDTAHRLRLAQQQTISLRTCLDLLFCSLLVTNSRIIQAGVVEPGSHAFTRQSSMASSRTANKSLVINKQMWEQVGKGVVQGRGSKGDAANSFKDFDYYNNSLTTG